VFRSLGNGLVLAVMMASAAAAQSPPPRLEAFAVVPPNRPDAPPMHCTPDERWCAQISRDVDTDESTLYVFAGHPREPTRPVLSHPLPAPVSDEKFSLWPKVVRLAGPQGGMLLGVETRLTVGYSGGGGSSSDLLLLRLTVKSADELSAASVLSVPLAGSQMIRACFGEKDERARRGACHDEYEFAATLSLAPATGEADDPPPLVYETVATTYPGDVSRDADSTQRPPLRQSDLVRVRDPACSYRRLMRFDGAVYVPDSPLPDCSQYAVP
jgi:hypothetical protein